MSLAGVMSQLARNWSSVVIIVLGLLVLTSVGQRIRGWYRLRHFKGPFPAAFSRFWLLRHSLGGRLQWDFADVTDKYGMSDVDIYCFIFTKC